MVTVIQKGQAFIQPALTAALSPAGQASLLLLLPEGVCLITVEQSSLAKQNTHSL